MTLSAKDKKFVNDGLSSIDTALTYQHGAVEPENRATKASLQPAVLINNTAYHDYVRLELGTPIMATKIFDKTINGTVLKILEMTADHPSWFSDAARNNKPTDADTVEQLLSEMKADLASMGAGPVPGLVQAFVVEALADYIDQTIWTSLGPGERDRLAQLASAWAALTERPAAAGNSGAGGGIFGSGLGGGTVDELRSLFTEFADHLKSMGGSN